MENKNNNSETLSNALNIFADKLGVKADQLFDTVMEQAKIQFYMDVLYLVLYAILLAVGIFSALYLKPIWLSKETFSDSKQFVVVIGTLVSVACLLIPLGCATSTIYEMITLKLNPKYWALKDILSNIQKN